MAQIGSVQWYNEMAGKLKVVTAEIHVGRLSMLYKINITDLDQINGLITKAMNRLSESYKKTINAFWNCTPVSNEKFDMNKIWNEFNESLGKPWENPLKAFWEPTTYKEDGGRYIFGCDPADSDGIIHRKLMTKNEFDETYPFTFLEFTQSESYKNNLKDVEKHRVAQQSLDLQSGKIKMSDIVKTFDIPHENGTTYRTHFIPYEPFNEPKKPTLSFHIIDQNDYEKPINPVKELLAKNFIGRDYPTYAGKMFYLYDRQALVYCHEQKGGTLIIGDCSTFISDAVTCICRNKISVEKFLLFRPLEVDTKKLHMYPQILQQHQFSFGGAVWETKRLTELKLSERILEGSTELPHAYISNFGKGMM